MKLAALATLFVPGMAFAAWTTTDFPAFTEEGTGRFISQKVVEKGTRPLQLNFDQQCWQPSGGIKLNQMLSMEPCRGTPPQWRIFRQGLYTLEVDTRSGTPTMMISLEEKETSAAAPQIRQCPKWDGKPLTIDVSKTFAEGSKVRDFYSGNVATVSGGTKGDFPHYAYHGYYTQDWSKLDANMGTEADLRRLVDEAHKRGIRILFDVVMNHAGYATLADMQEFQFGSLYLQGDELKKTLGERWTDWKPGAGQTWHSFNDYINFSDKAGWEKWWGKKWIRTDIGDYDNPGYDDLTMSLAFLPDLKTESKEVSGLPNFYNHKPDTAAKAIPGYTPRDYLTHWLSQWVRDYGIDGFRVDTAKHVEMDAWQQLKTQATAALAEWKKANPDKALDAAPFWMTGEAWGHGVMQSDYYRHGFDAMINFDYQDQAAKAATCMANIDLTWQQMADKLQSFNVLSYLSSHDTRLFREGGTTAAELLLLAPGAVQIFYGDESSRPFGPTGSDPLQGTRSEMNWQDVNGKAARSVTHWQKIGQFRARHPAIGMGKQTTLSMSRGYGFVRESGEDKVMVIWAGQQQ